MGVVKDLLAALKTDGRLIHVETQAHRAAVLGTLSQPLPDSIAHCLPRSGLFSHQTEAINLIRQKTSTVIATGTASGKSLCYQLPIAESVVSGVRPGTAVLVYPTKALAQDQLRAFEAMSVPGLRAFSYDGDASRQQRTEARARANVLLTNPEMLHYGIAPHHSQWATFFKRLEHIVIDELHVLRGIFGTHVGHLLRRLRRICALYGSDPTFVFTSATIGSPEILASDLAATEVVAVSSDGSPRGQRHIALVQPALIDPESGRRQTPATEAIAIVSGLVSAGRRVISFCPSRAMTERVAAGVARALPADLASTVRPYRSGYLVAERRQIEGEVASGAVRALVTTSALELGVDIGGLDATVLCGFPNTVASFWQQIGRAGRDGQESLAVLVAGNDQLDQWFMNHPVDLFERSPEPAVINVANANILDPHLGCAAYEIPLMWGDSRWWPDLDNGVRRLVGNDELRIRPDRRRLPRAYWSGDGMPFHRIGLRSASSGEVRIVGPSEELIGTVDTARAQSLVHAGAIYLHRGQPWKIRELDLASRTAWAEPDPGDTWTQTKSDVSIEVLGSLGHKQIGRAVLHRGSVKVTTQITGYQIRQTQGSSRTQGRSLVGTVDLEVEPSELLTSAIWYEWEHSVVGDAGIGEAKLPGALHGVEHAAIGILPLFTICDRWDVGGVSISAADQSDLPTVFIYDGYPGGAGIAELAYAAGERHLEATADVLDGCGCATGCPSCVQSPKCGNGNQPLDKMAALALLRTTLGEAEPF